MNLLKRVLVFVMGIGVLLTVLVMFSCSMQTTNLESGTMKDWETASMERRVAAVKILTATDADTDIIVACVNKIATLPDSDKMAVRDATSLCYTGMQIKDGL